MTKKTKPLTEENAIEVLRRGGCLNSSSSQGWGVMPGSARERGGLVTSETAKRIMARPDVKPGKRFAVPRHGPNLADAGRGRQPMSNDNKKSEAEKVAEFARIAQANAHIKELGHQIDRLDDQVDRLRATLNRLCKDGVDVELGPTIDCVIETLRADPRMPKLSLFEWEQLLGDHYGTETVDIAEEIGDINDQEDEAA